MKIIGVAGDNRIIHCSKDELSNLMGFHSAYSLERERQNLDAGTTVDVAGIFKEATFVLEMQREFLGQIESTQTKLTRLATLLRGKPKDVDKK